MFTQSLYNKVLMILIFQLFDEKVRLFSSFQVYRLEDRKFISEVLDRS